MSTVYLCPKCGSAAVDMAVVVGGSCRCRACNFTGSIEDFPGASADNPTAGLENVYAAFALDMKQVMMKDLATPLGRVLLKYGFIDNPPKPAQMSLYLSTMLKALVDGTVAAREKEIRKMRGGN